MIKKINQDKLVWKSEYSIGHYKTDVEHMKLFEIAKKALDSKKKNQHDKDELKKIITSLYEYIGTHFKNEESYMKEIIYPDLQRHREIHKYILDTLHKFINTLNDLTLDEIEIQLFNFIEEYFIRHIVDEDKRIEFWNKSLQRLRTSTRWFKSYETGNKLIDDGHKNLFSIVNEAFEEVDDDQREDKIKNVLKHLYDFMKSYFKEEELYMKEIKYPDCEEHMQMHNEIIEHCNQLVFEVNNMEDSIFEKELAKLIDIILLDHMLKEDKKLVIWENKE